MNDLKISKTDLCSELRNPPNSEEMEFNNWYDKNIKELRVIQKTKKGFKVIVLAHYFRKEITGNYGKEI